MTSTLSTDTLLAYIARISYGTVVPADSSANTAPALRYLKKSTDGFENHFVNVANALSDTEYDALFGDQTLSILYQQPNDTYGFSATLFKKLNPDGSSSFSIAFRGTEPWTLDLSQDALLAFEGLPINQIVAEYNFYQKLVTPPEQDAIGYSVNPLWLFAPAGKQMLLPVNLGKGAGMLAPSDKVDVTGHSLGGYLANAFALLFPNVVSSSTTFNAAGFNTALPGVRQLGLDISGQVFAALGGKRSFAELSVPIKNYYAEPGLNVTTSDVTFNQPGNRIPLYIDYAGGPISVDAHGITHPIEHLSIAAFAPIPMMVKLGALIGNKRPAQILDLPNNNWLWRNDAAALEPADDWFVFYVPAQLPGHVFVAIDISNQARGFEGVVGNTPVIRFSARNPRRELIGSQMNLEGFSRRFGEFLAQLNRAGVVELDLLPVTSLSASVEVGRVLLPKTFSRVSVWEYKDPNWVKAVNLVR